MIIYSFLIIINYTIIAFMIALAECLGEEERQGTKQAYVATVPT
tara:strand:+ start:329 stop:460 length:132 start_codon:yes stop_codon:yes gene_type:complete